MPRVVADARRCRFDAVYADDAPYKRATAA